MFRTNAVGPLLVAKELVLARLLGRGATIANMTSKARTACAVALAGCACAATARRDRASPGARRRCAVCVFTAHMRSPLTVPDKTRLPQMGSVSDNTSGNTYSYRASKAALNISCAEHRPAQLARAPALLWRAARLAIVRSSAAPTYVQLHAARNNAHVQQPALQLDGDLRRSSFTSLTHVPVVPMRPRPEQAAGARAVTKSLAIDLEDDGIACVLLHPGPRPRCQPFTRSPSTCRAPALPVLCRGAKSVSPELSRFSHAAASACTMLRNGHVWIVRSRLRMPDACISAQPCTTLLILTRAPERLL